MASRRRTLHGRVEVHIIEGTIENLDVDGDLRHRKRQRWRGWERHMQQRRRQCRRRRQLGLRRCWSNVDAGGSVTSGEVHGHIGAGGEITNHAAYVTCPAPASALFAQRSLWQLHIGRQTFRRTHCYGTMSQEQTSPDEWSGVLVSTQTESKRAAPACRLRECAEIGRPDRVRPNE